MWVYNCCAWAFMCVSVCRCVCDCELHNQKAKTTVSPQIKRISWRREIEWNSSCGYKKETKRKTLKLKTHGRHKKNNNNTTEDGWKPCIWRYACTDLYMYIMLYMSWCVCVCIHFNFHFHCGCGSLFLPRQPTIDSSTAKSKHQHHHQQHHYNKNNNKCYETTAMSLMQIFVYSKSNRNRIKTKNKNPTKKPTMKLKRGSYYWQF